MCSTKSKKEDRRFKKERNQHGNEEERTPKTIVKRSPRMTAVQEPYKTVNLDQSKRSKCFRRDIPKIKMDLRGSLIGLTVLVSL